MVTTHILGYPRIGAGRELKFALEAFWRGEADETYLKRVAADLRRKHWDRQAAAGLSFVAAGDFAFSDQILNQAALLGALPRRFGFDAHNISLQDYFAMARGSKAQPALEMTKWFDTNYHYLVPELEEHARFEGGPEWYYEEIAEALALGRPVKPVLIGPVTFLRLSKPVVAGVGTLPPRLAPGGGGAPLPARRGA